MGIYYEEGRYRVRIIDQVLSDGEKRADGSEKSPSLILEVEVLGMYNRDGELEGIKTSQYGRRIYLPLTDGTIGTAENPGWVLLTLRFLGWEGVDFGELNTASKPCCSFEGLEVDATCSYNEYQGKTNERWSIFRPKEPGEGTKPMESKGIKMLNAKFANVLKKTKPTAGKTQTPPRAPRPKPEQATKASPTSDQVFQNQQEDLTSDIPF